MPIESTSVDQVVVAGTHAADYIPDRCDVALIHLAPTDRDLLIYYRDALAALASEARARFPGSVSVIHELRVWLGRIRFIDYYGTDLECLPDSDPLYPVLAAAADDDCATLLPANFDFATYELDALTASTDTHGAFLSAQGIIFYAFAGDTRVSTTQIGWDTIERIAADPELD